MIILRNILSVILGWFVGSGVNMGLVMLGHTVFPGPEGMDPNNMESLKEFMPQMGAEHFIFPFLAHALGTLVGAILAGLIAGSKKMVFAMVIGGFFFLGGIAVSFMVPAPTWFTILDLLLAYIPMGFLGGQIALRFAGQQAQ